MTSSNLKSQDSDTLLSAGKPFYLGICRFVATGGYVGLIPIAPGTVGTCAAAGLFYLLHLSSPVLASFWGSMFFALCLTVLAIWVAEQVLRLCLFGTGSCDPQQVVIDEFAGLAVTVIGIGPEIRHWILGVIVFRLFDIVKPPPVRQLETLPGGFGLVLDDVFAGVYSNVCCRLIINYL